MYRSDGFKLTFYVQWPCFKEKYEYCPVITEYKSVQNLLKITDPVSRYTDQTLQGEQQQTIFIWYQSKTKRKDLDLTNKTPKKSEFIMQSKYWPPPSLSVLFFGQVWALDTQTSSCHRRLRFHRLRSTPKGIRRDHNFKGNSHKTLPKPNIYPQNFRYLSKYLPLIALIHIASVVAVVSLWQIVVVVLPSSKDWPQDLEKRATHSRRRPTIKATFTGKLRDPEGHAFQL